MNLGELERLDCQFGQGNKVHVQTTTKISDYHFN